MAQPLTGPTLWTSPIAATLVLLFLPTACKDPTPSEQLTMTPKAMAFELSEPQGPPKLKMITART